jgi:hypothetical protein
LGVTTGWHLPNPPEFPVEPVVFLLHMVTPERFPLPIEVSRSQVQHQDPQLNQPDNQNIKELFADFLDAIKNKRRPKCDIEVAHRSTNMSLLGMLALKLGRSIEWDGDKETIVGDPEADKLLLTHDPLAAMATTSDDRPLPPSHLLKPPGFG